MPALEPIGLVKRRIDTNDSIAVLNGGLYLIGKVTKICSINPCLDEVLAPFECLSEVFVCEIIFSTIEELSTIVIRGGGGG